ncbi:uncharacterized protein LOC143027290 [Oratosquilla oratoria]|uniref:uncharacterized protein LOC143027290 n=1 Tax=Oratosquilla oratoria TaxID=337810 RepID=UPI003F75935C
MCPLGSPTVALIDDANRGICVCIRNLREFGILDQWMREGLRNGTRCYTPADAEAKAKERPLALQDFYGIFLLYLAGQLTALAILVCEMFLSNMTTSDDEKKRP